MTVYRAASNFPQLTCPALGCADGLSDVRQYETWRSTTLAAIGTGLTLSPLATVTRLEDVRDDLAGRRAARTSEVRDTRSPADFYPMGA